MLLDLHNGAGIARKITQCERLVVGVKGEGLYKALSPVGEIISVLIGCRKVRARVPSTADTTISCEWRSRHRRARSSHIGCLRLAGPAVSRRPCDCAVVIPIQYRPGMEELRDGTWYHLRTVARIGERRLPRGIQRVFVKQLAERKILAASRAGIQRVWSVLISHIPIVTITTQHIQSLKQRPTKIVPRSGYHIHRFPSVPTKITNVKDPGVPVRREMTTRIWPQAHAIRIAQS